MQPHPQRKPSRKERWKAKLIHIGRPPPESSTNVPEKAPRLSLPFSSSEALNVPQQQQRGSNDVRLGEASQQIGSLLFRLPLELREMIYPAVFGPYLIHIVQYTRQTSEYDPHLHRLAHVRCLRQRPDERWDGHRHGWTDFNCSSILVKINDPNDELLALCLTCRSL